ncbi:MAG: hypothetical protein ACOH5I_08005 [Oligoflexus sp.]
MHKLRNFNRIALIISFFLGAGCGYRSSDNPQTPRTVQGCDGLTLLSNLGFHGQFFHQFLQCLSSSSEQIPATRKISTVWGEEGYQSLVDWLLMEHPQSEQLGSKYPYLTLVATLLDRASYTLDQQELFGEHERFVSLQALLKDIDPSQAAHLILSWHRSGQLTSLLQEWSHFIKLWPSGSFSGILQKSSEDDAFMQDLLAIARATLAQPDVYAPWTELFMQQEFLLVHPSCLISNDGCHDETLPISADSEYIHNPMPAKEALNVEHWLDFWHSRSEASRKRLLHFFGRILFDVKDVSLSNFNRYLQEGILILKNWMMQNPGLSESLIPWLLPLSELSLDELNPLVNGLAEIAENPLYVDALQEKAGASRLKRLLEKFFWQGGQLDACDSLNVPGLATASSPGLRQQYFLQMISPHAACSGLSPLLAYSLEVLNADCDVGCQERLPAWLHQLQVSTPGAGDWQILIDYGMQRLAAELKADPFYLQHRRLAYGPLTPADYQAFAASMAKHQPLTLESFLAWEEDIAAQPNLNGLLIPNFLELWLSEIIFSLSVSTYQLKDLFPADPSKFDAWLQAEHDQRLLRSFLGFYEGGPARPWLQTWATEILPLPDSADHQTQRRLQHLKQGFSFIHGMFKNPELSFQAEVENIQLPWSGSLSNQTRIDSEGQVIQEKSAIDFAALLGFTEQTDSPSEFALWQRFQRQLPLLTDPTERGVDAVETIQDLFRNWQTLSRPDLASKNISYPGLPEALFTGKPFSTDEARLLLLFFGQNFYAKQAANHDIWNGLSVNPLPTEQEINRNLAPRIFAGATNTASPQRAWSAMVQWAPQQSLIQGESLQAWIAAMQVPAEEIQAVMQKRAQQPLLVGLQNMQANPIAQLSEYEKILGIGQLLSFIYASRGEQYLVPSLGFASYCPQLQTDGSWQTGSCPFQAETHAAYEQAVQQNFLNQLCPVLMDLAAFDLQKTSQILQVDPSFTQSCRDFTASSSYVPQVLFDIWKIGQQSDLKPEVLSLPLQIRLAKLQQKPAAMHHLADYDALRLSLSPILSARLLQREESYGLFRQNHPGLFSSIIQQLGGLLGDRLLSEKLKELPRRLAGEPSTNEHPIDRIVLDLVDEFQLARLQGDHLLSFTAASLQRFAQEPEAMEHLASIIADPHDPYTGILLGFTLGQALDADVFPEFSAEQAGYRWLLYHLRADNWQALTQFISNSQYDLLTISQYLAKDVLVPAEDLADLLRFTLALIYSQDQVNAIDPIKLATTRLPADAIPAMARVSREILYQPLANLENHWQSPLAQKPAVLIDLLASALPALARTQIKASQEAAPSFFASAWHLIKAWDQPKNIRQQAYLVLQDQRLGLRQPALWHHASTDQEALLRMTALLDHVDRIPRSDWQALSDEMDQLLDGSYRFLDFAAQNTIWQADAEKDFAYALAVLGRTARSSLRRQANFDLLKLWLKPADESDPSASQTAVPLRRRTR